MADLIEWPKAAKFDRVLAKERLYAESGADTALRQRFVDEVQRVRWAFKLAEESLRLVPGDEVTEIQIITIDLKGSSLDDSVLAAIDRTIPSQIIFELRRDGRRDEEVCQAAAHKRAGGRTTAADYFHTGWKATDAARAPLPTALDLDSLYEQLLSRLLPHPMGPGETLPEAIERVGRVRRLDREVHTMEKRMRNEVQFNRKVELRTELRAKLAERDDLAAGGNRSTEDA